ncbi:hypothetical protein BGZ70_004667, partial [Mortierella alpina]
DEEDEVDEDEVEDKDEFNEEEEGDEAQQQVDDRGENEVAGGTCGGGLQGDAHGEESALLRFGRVGHTRNAGSGRVDTDDDETLSENSDDEADDDEERDVPTGGRETDKEKLRRDSGVGQDTLEAEVAMLGISERASALVAGSESLDHHHQHQQQQQQQQSMTEFWSPSLSLRSAQLLPQRRPRRVVYKSPLASLLIQNRNLRRVEVYVERKSPGGSFWRALAASPTSTHCDPTMRSSLLASRDATSLRPSFCACPRLSAFQSLVNLQVHKYIDAFWQMCTRLETLDLERCTLRQLDAERYEALWFPRLRELKFGRVREMSLLSQLQVMRQCPELEVLDWRVPHLGFPVDEFCQALEEGRWRKLKSLTLPETRLTDDALARILHGIAASGVASLMKHTAAVVPPSSPSSRTMNSAAQAPARVAIESGSGRTSSSTSSSWPPATFSPPLTAPTNRLLRCTTTARESLPHRGLTTLAVRRSDFGPLAFSALKQHFSTIQSLDLYQCPSLTSAMTQEILMNCPSLESFDGHRLLAKDIIDGLSGFSRRSLDHPSCSGAGASGTSGTKQTFDSYYHHHHQPNEEKDHSTVASGWVCRGLRYLDVHITGFPDAGFSTCTHVEISDNSARDDHDTTIHVDNGSDGHRVLECSPCGMKRLLAGQMQWTVFSQLAQLHKLVHLSVGGKSTVGRTTPTTAVQAGTAGMVDVSSTALSSSLPSPATEAPVNPAATTFAARAATRGVRNGGGGLDMRLRSGLGQLKTLRKLRMLRFTGLEQHMEQEDVAWMVEHLPELRVVQGRLHSDGCLEAALGARLEAGGVSAWTMYNQQPL